jgi:ABC-2 type transport system ATP-binding protein
LLMNTVITIDNLHKRYGQRIAVEDVSLSIARGEIFGIVGPNGAGKTTTVECLSGLRYPDSGSIRVLGLDPRRDARTLRQRLGIQLQEAALPERIRVGEALDLFAAFYSRPADPRRLLATWGLAEQIRQPVDRLSGGQRQRLFIALALINNPEVVIFDELTTALDPQARRATWDLVRQIRDTGTTIVLVTHFMDEAEALCDRVAVIDRGVVIALDRPAALVSAYLPPQRVQFRVTNGFDPRWLETVPGVRRAQQRDDQVTVDGDEGLLGRMTAVLGERGIAPADLRATRPTLEDVFLTLTGRPMSN